MISTKIGRVFRDCRPEEVPQFGFVETPARTFDFDYSYDGVMRSHYDSLKRLGVERIDILLVHDIDKPTHGSREAADRRIRELFDDGGYRALEELRAGGVVKSIGAGMNEWEASETLLGLGDFDCFLLAGRYTLLEQEALDSFLPLCEERNVSIIIGGPFNSGILVSGAIEGARYKYAARHLRHPRPRRPPRRHLRLLRGEAHRGGAPLRAGHPAVKTVIPGVNTPGQVKANASPSRREDARQPYGPT